MPADDREDRRRSEPELYEPLPDLAGMPAWLWRRTSRRARVALAAGLVLLAGSVAALVPGMREAQRERDAAELRERAERRLERARELRAEQRPRLGRSPSVAPAGSAPAERLAARAGLVGDLADAIVADARRRVRSGDLDGPILRAECQPFPRSDRPTGPEDDLSLRFGRYSCLAVTSEFGATEGSVGGLLGHTYRARVDFTTGRLAYCKIAGRPGPERDPLVTTPRACGG